MLHFVCLLSFEQNSHARTPKWSNTTRNTVQKSDFPRSWLIGSAFRKPATTSATGAEQQNLLSTEGNAPAANAPNASNWGIDWLQEFWWIKDSGWFGKNKSLLYFNIFQLLFEAMANRPHTQGFHQMAWIGMKHMLRLGPLFKPMTPFTHSLNMLSEHVSIASTSIPKTHPSGFKIPKDCQCSTFLKLRSLKLLSTSLERGIRSLTLETSLHGNKKRQMTTNARTTCWHLTSHQTQHETPLQFRVTRSDPFLPFLGQL